eukprot:TRINITY_DN26992_c0_g2_i1.p1 TRINITY_DN26992_c0_g2~~TRINITY_DN26992_c0_g2_i1.p1  ORF type:complete len:279 (+),score=73.34 TRINITY_DN26992_c0_g2_i1:130-966(+)
MLRSLVGSEMCIRDRSQVDGHPSNLTVFAYGQTGSGKTYTMVPIYNRIAWEAVTACDSSASTQLSISFFEIYCSKVLDLLADRAVVRTLEDAKGQVQVAGLVEVPVEDMEQAAGIIARGQDSRVTHANAVHEQSSRSHAVLQLLLRDSTSGSLILTLTLTLGISGKLVGKLVLVDLAGSERASETLSDDKATRHEGAEINKSLLALKECIRAMGRGDKHQQFRGSKLTQILRDGLVGKRSRAVMIAALSPASGSTEHTLNTLRYADRLKEIGLRRQSA